MELLIPAMVDAGFSYEETEFMLERNDYIQMDYYIRKFALHNIADHLYQDFSKGLQ